MTGVGDGRKNFILASASPQRRKLLSKAAYEFEVVVSDVDESQFDGCLSSLTACDYASLLARTKAAVVAKKFPSRLVVGADTCVDFDGEIIGKAANPAEAHEIVKKLFSRPHKIVTAISMIKSDEQIELVDFAVTTVFPAAMTASEISSHIASGEWKGKAGAYSIQSEKGAFIERIEGSYTNVMGLSMELFEKMIKAVWSGANTSNR